MITYQNMTPSQTLEDRIVAIPLVLPDDQTATKIMCINSTNKLRYKTDTNAYFESRIVSVANTGIDTTAVKVLVITAGNLLRYKSDTNATFEERIVSTINTSVDSTATKLVCVTNGNLLRYKSDTNANFESRIVSIIQTVGYGVDTTSTKMVCVTDGNLLRYRTLSPSILTTVYSGVFNSTTGETVILTLPTGIKFEFLLSINILSYYNTVANASWNAGLCWAGDHDATVFYASNSADNPSTATTFRMYRRTARMASSPYKLTITYM